MSLMYAAFSCGGSLSYSSSGRGSVYFAVGPACSSVVRSGALGRSGIKKLCRPACVLYVRCLTEGPPLLGLPRNTYTTYLVPDTFKFLSLDDFKRLSPSAKQAYLEELKRYVDAATQ